MKRRVMLNQIPAENPKYSVTIQVKKDNLVYSSNATLPNITFNNETQVVNPNGNTFSNVEEGEYAVSVSSTAYNDSYSGNITVNSSNTNFTISVLGYYDWNVYSYYYPDNNSSNSKVNAGGLVFKLTLTSSSSDDDYLYSGTTNADGTAKVTSYKVRNDTTYIITYASQKLSNNACIVSSSVSFGYLGSGGDSMSSSICLTLASYQIQIALYKDVTNSTWTPSTYPTVSITSKDGTTTSAGWFSSGVAYFNSIPYSSSFTVSVGSTTYNYALTTTVSPITGLASAYSASVTLTGKYYIKAEIYNSITGTYFNGCTVKVYLQNASGTNLTYGTTNSGGDILFNSSTSYMFTYGDTVKIYVPAQTVTSSSNGKSYSISATTFSKALNTSNATITSSTVNKDTAYFRELSVTTESVPVNITRTIPFYSSLNNICTETGSGWSSINYTGSSFTPTYTSMGFVSYSNEETSYSGWDTHNAYVTYSIGGSVLWKSKPWAMVVHMYGDFRNSSYSGFANIGFGVKCKSSSCTSINDATVYVKANDSGKVTFVNLLSHPIAETANINSDGEYNISISHNPDKNEINITIENGSGKTVSKTCTVFSMSDDTDTSYFMLGMGPAFIIKEVEFGGYIT